MPKQKKPKFVFPFLEIVMNAEGENIFTLRAKQPIIPTASHFAAAIKMAPTARPYAVAITLIETAMAMVMDEEEIIQRLRLIVAQLVMKELPMSAFMTAFEDDELPF